MKNVLDCLQARGLVDAITSEELRARLNQPIKLYLGIDPTADSLHLGHWAGMMVTAWFQRYGHTPTILVGGATGRIGDPSGKSIERPVLSEEDLKHNVKSLKSQLARLLNFEAGTTAAGLVDNDTWLGSMTLVQFLRDVGRHFRVGVMLGKESVRARLESEEGISYTEFSYQILQAFDFYHLHKTQNVELQLGGSDQWGNITAGLDLIRKLEAKTAFGLTFPLLVRSDGKKFGKSEQGAIWLDSDKLSPYQFYQYLMRIPDADVIDMMKKLTFMELEEIAEYAHAMNQPSYLANSAQKRLAEELTRLVHGDDGLLRAERATQGAAPGSEGVLDAAVFESIRHDVPNFEIALADIVNRKLLDLFVETKLTSSKGEALRTLQGGGVYLNNQKIVDAQYKIAPHDLIGDKFLLLAIGKKKKALVIAI